MAKPLRLLLIEDSEDDTLLLIRQLKKGGFAPDWQRVEDEPALRKALRDPSWEIVISDYAMPNLTGLEALEIFKSFGADIPFIIVSGTVGEDVAVEAMRAGASDYLLKDKLTRLVPAVQRELRESRGRQRLRKTEAELFIQKMLHEELFMVAPEATVLLDKNSRVLRVNPEFTRIFGYSSKDLKGKRLDDAVVPKNFLNEARKITQAVAAGEIVNLETVRQRKDGTRINVSILATPVKVKGKKIGYYGIYRDISDRKRAEEKLIRSEERFRQLVNTIPAIVWRCDAETTRFTYVSEQTEGILGYSPEEWIQNPTFWRDHMHPEDRTRALELCARATQDHRPHEFEYRMIAKNGREVWLKDYVNIVFKDKKPTELIGVMVDITEAKKAAEELSRSEKRFRDMADLLPQVIYETDPEGLITFVNQAVLPIFSVKPEELIGKINVFDMMVPEDRHRALETKEKILRGEKLSIRQYTIKNFAGKEFPVFAQTVPVYQGEKLVGLRGILVDISEQKQAEANLRESEARFRTVVESLDEGIIITDPDDCIIYVNSRILSMTGYSLKEMLARNAGKLLLTGEDYRAGLNRLKLRKQGIYSKYVTQIRRKDGSFFWAEVNGAPFRNNAGEIVGTLGAITDITERFLAEERLRANEERYRELFENALVGITVTTVDGQMKACNPAFAKIFRFGSVEEALQSNIGVLYPDAQEREKLLQLIRSRKKLEYYELELKNRQGKQVYVMANMIGSFNEKGELEEITTYIFDDTPRKEIEQQLNQAQKMESLGTLAGGIAHDFNNLLSVINGYSELLLAQKNLEERTAKFIRQIHEAGERAANLTTQILAFSRKQNIQPKIVDINETVQNISKMIRRLIGEDIILKTFFNSSETRVKIDPVQIEQVVMNLAVNARDAMPEGGTLTIATGMINLDDEYARRHVDVKPGPYVLLTVRDEGIGMDASTLTKVFEPFFTTKGKGRGTGLGLSTVYGIVKQNGGHIGVNSEPGQGTTFNIYLPLVREGARSSNQTDGSVENLRGDEMILVVEDDESVRALCRENLETAGYTVLEAADGQKALEIARKESQKIKMVLTDVIMPGMNGRQLADKLAEIIPHVEVVFVSGYTDNALLQIDGDGSHFDFIQKPYSAKVLLRKVREVLNRVPD